MSTETLEPPAAEPAENLFAQLDSLLAGDYSDDPPLETELAVDPPPAKEDAPPVEADKKPDDEAPPAEPSPKPGSFKALKLEKEREMAETKAKYEADLAEANERAARFETEAKTHAEKVGSAEALRLAHEKELTELQQKIVAEYETPYSLEYDPDAQKPLADLRESEKMLDHAVRQAATSLGSNQQAANAIFQNKKLFAGVLGSMAQGLTPDVEHADYLVTELGKMGVAVSAEDARDAVRGLKTAVPQLGRYQDITQYLKNLQAKNEPEWTNQQAARHEAYRREVLKHADVADDAAEGDDATMAAILKANPERRTKLQAEADRLSAQIIGPAPGKATAAAVRAAPQVLHQNAVKAARLPVALEAYRETSAENATLKARVAELEARIGKESGGIPKPAGTVTPVKATLSGKNLDDELKRALEMK